jgi:hypothetical protein
MREYPPDQAVKGIARRVGDAQIVSRGGKLTGITDIDCRAKGRQIRIGRQEQRRGKKKVLFPYALAYQGGGLYWLGMFFSSSGHDVPGSNLSDFFPMDSSS